MDKYIIEGGLKLHGRVRAQSAKNTVLPLLAASVLTDEPVKIRNMPAINDVENMLHILNEVGCKIKRQKDCAVIDSSNAVSHEIPARLTKELRSSVFMLGSVLTRFHRAKISYPGGCDIGLRPIDLHLAGLKRLGVKILEKDGYIHCEADKLIGAEILLDFPSVGATENIILAAVKAEGITIIRNAAKEPEIVDLQNFLNAMGAKVRGAGGGAILIEGVRRLHGVDYTPIGDRIEVGTYLIATAACGGEIEVQGVFPENIAALLHKLRENGCKIHTKNDKIILSSDGRLKAVSLVESGNVKIIDTSTAHRTNDAWAYGFAELSDAHRQSIAASHTQMNGMTLQETDKIIYPVCSLCRDHQRVGFVEGVKIGLLLAGEVMGDAVFV